MAEKFPGTALMKIPEVDRNLPQKREQIRIATLTAKWFEMAESQRKFTAVEARWWRKPKGRKTGQDGFESAP